MGNKIGHDFYGHRVVPALGDNDVGVSFCRFDMLQMHRFQNPFVAFDNHFDRTSSFDNIPVEERQNINFDEPAAIDFNLLVKHLKELKAGHSIEQPIYSFLTCTRSNETITVEPRDRTLRYILQFERRYRMND